MQGCTSLQWEVFFCYFAESFVSFLPVFSWVLEDCGLIGLLLYYAIYTEFAITIAGKCKTEYSGSPVNQVH